MNAHNEQQALPCPFCGREPDLSFNSVSCGCAASPFIDREDALQVWNTRAAQPSPVVKQNLTTQPAAAQEAVAEVVRPHVPESMTHGEAASLRPRVQMLKPMPPVGTKLYAAPITAAPGIDRATLNELLAAAGDAAAVLQNKVGPMEQETPRRLYAALNAFQASLIDASPKGEDSIARAFDRAVLEPMRRGAKADSPKGGSDARDAARYRWLREFAVNGSIGIPFHGWLNCDEPASEWDSAIDDAMQAGDAEVQTLCDLCRKRPEAHSDAEGIGFCEVCWGEWVKANSHGAGVK